MCKSLHYFSSHQKAFAFLFSWGRGRWTPGKEAGTVPSLRSWCGWESRIWAGRWLLYGLCYCFTLCPHAQSHLILWDPTDCSSPSFSICGMFQARLLEWVAICSSRGSSQPRDPTHISCISCIGKRILYQCTPCCTSLHSCQWCKRVSLFSSLSSIYCF